MTQIEISNHPLVRIQKCYKEPTRDETVSRAYRFVCSALAASSSD